MGAITSFELSVLHFIENNLQNPVLNIFFGIFSMISEYGAIWILLAIFLLFSKKYRKGGFALALALIFFFIFTNLFLKNIIARPRPFSLEEFNIVIPKPSDFSFPSGHTATSFCGALILAKTNSKWAVPAYAVAVLTAISRIYFTVHFPTDILGGIVSGTLASIFALFVCKKIEKKSNFFNNGFFSGGRGKC